MSEQPTWLDAEGRVVCARCGQRRGYSWDRESREPICGWCQDASIQAADDVYGVSGSDQPQMDVVRERCAATLRELTALAHAGFGAGKPEAACAAVFKAAGVRLVLSFIDDAFPSPTTESGGE